MLEYFKTILTKVSFDRKIFEKELTKAIQALVDQEIHQLQNWCVENFASQHPLVLQRCFN